MLFVSDCNCLLPFLGPVFKLVEKSLAPSFKLLDSRLIRRLGVTSRTVVWLFSIPQVDCLQTAKLPNEATGSSILRARVASADARALRIGRIEGQSVGLVDILVSGQTIKHRLQEQPVEAVDRILADATFV